MSPIFLSVPVDAVAPVTLFDVSFPAEDPALNASVSTVGVLQPLLARHGADGLELVSGFRRLRAVHRAGNQSVPVQVLDSARASDPQSFLLRLHEAVGHRPFNDVEKSNVLWRAAARLGMPKGELRHSVCPLLDLPDAPDTVPTWVALQRLSADFHALMLRRGVAARHAALVAGLEGDDRSTVEGVAIALDLGGNKIRELVLLAGEIGRRDGCSVAAVLRSDEIAAARMDAARTADQRWQRLTRVLHRRRLPTWGRLERDLQAHVRALGLPESVRVDYPPYLEGDQYRCSFAFRTTDDVRRVVEALRAAADHPAMTRLLEML